jgi:hypothetical protein
MMGIQSESDWKAKEDARILQMAEEIKRDTKRMAAAQKIAEKEMTAMKSVIKMKPVKSKISKSTKKQKGGV